MFFLFCPLSELRVGGQSLGDLSLKKSSFFYALPNWKFTINYHINNFSSYIDWYRNIHFLNRLSSIKDDLFWNKPSWK